MKQQLIEQENKMLRAMIKVLTGRSVGTSYSLEYMLEKTKLFEDFTKDISTEASEKETKEILTNLLNI